MLNIRRTLFKVNRPDEIFEIFFARGRENAAYTLPLVFPVKID